MKTKVVIFLLLLFLPLGLEAQEKKVYLTDISGEETLVEGVDWGQIKKMLTKNERGEFELFILKHFEIFEREHSHKEIGVSAFFKPTEIRQYFSEFEKADWKNKVCFFVRTDDPEKALILFDLMKDVNEYSDSITIQDEGLIEDNKELALYINVLDKRHKKMPLNKKKGDNIFIVYVRYNPDYKQLKEDINDAISQFKPSDDWLLVDKISEE